MTLLVSADAKATTTITRPDDASVDCTQADVCPEACRGLYASEQSALLAARARALRKGLQREASLEQPSALSWSLTAVLLLGASAVGARPASRAGGSSDCMEGASKAKAQGKDL